MISMKSDLRASEIQVESNIKAPDQIHPIQRNIGQNQILIPKVQESADQFETASSKQPHEVKMKPYEGKPIFLKSQEYKNLGQKTLLKIDLETKKPKGTLVTNSTEYFTFNRKRKTEQAFSPIMRIES